MDHGPAHLDRIILEQAFPRVLHPAAKTPGAVAQIEIAQIKLEVDHYEKVRSEIKLASGDYIDLKMYEPAMRHLLDTYIRAEETEMIYQRTGNELGTDDDGKEYLLGEGILASQEESGHRVSVDAGAGHEREVTPVRRAGRAVGDPAEARRNVEHLGRLEAELDPLPPGPFGELPGHGQVRQHERLGRIGGGQLERRPPGPSRVQVEEDGPMPSPVVSSLVPHRPSAP